MDPLDITSYNHQIATLSTPNGEKKYHYVDQRPEGFKEGTPTPTMLLIHGFPDLWYGWRHQIGPWTRAGYRVIAPDCIGYGGSDKPEDLSNYTARSVSADLIALLDHLGINHPVGVVSHDWGAFISWRLCSWYPSRVKALVAACVAYSPPAREYTPLSELLKRAPTLSYFEYFISDSAVPELEKRLFKFFNLIFRSPHEDWSRGDNMRKWILDTCKPPLRSDLLEPEEMEVYLRAFSPNWEEKGSGMRAPLAYYKNWASASRVDDEKDLPARFPSHIKVLFFHPLQDPTCVPFVVERMKDNLGPQVKIATLDCGHWVMVEKSEEYSRTVLEWLETDGLKKKAQL